MSVNVHSIVTSLILFRPLQAQVKGGLVGWQLTNFTKAQLQEFAEETGELSTNAPKDTMLQSLKEWRKDKDNREKLNEYIKSLLARPPRDEKQTEAEQDKPGDSSKPGTSKA